MAVVPVWFTETLAHELPDSLTLSADQITQLWRHYKILLRWNRRINLTSIPPGKETAIRHYCESLFFGAYLTCVSRVNSIVDVGSGAGFPGVPIAVLKPAWSVTLVESSQRKAVFLREATRSIQNVSILAQRAEAMTKRFGWLVSRGVDPKEVVKCVPRLASQIGLMIGEDDFLQIRAAPDIAWREPVRLPWGDRRLCVYGVSRGTSE